MAVTTTNDIDILLEGLHLVRRHGLDSDGRPASGCSAPSGGSRQDIAGVWALLFDADLSWVCATDPTWLVLSQSDAKLWEERSRSSGYHQEAKEEAKKRDRGCSSGHLVLTCASLGRPSTQYWMVLNCDSLNCHQSAISHQPLLEYLLILILVLRTSEHHCISTSESYVWTLTNSSRGWISVVFRVVQKLNYELVHVNYKFCSADKYWPSNTDENRSWVNEHIMY